MASSNTHFVLAQVFFKAWSKQIFPDVKDDHQYHSCTASIYVYIDFVMAQKNVLKLFSSKGVSINTMLHHMLQSIIKVSYVYLFMER